MTIIDLTAYKKVKRAKEFLENCINIKKDLKMTIQILAKHTKNNKNINKICQELNFEIQLYEETIERFKSYIEKTKREINGE